MLGLTPIGYIIASMVSLGTTFVLIEYLAVIRNQPPKLKKIRKNPPVLKD